MKKSIKLDKEKAIDLYNKSNDNAFKEMLEESFGKNFWKPEDITKKVYDLTSLILETGDDPRIFNKPKDNFEKYINACSVLSKVAEIYNEGKVLDWKNNSEYKYLPYKYYNCSSCSVVAADCWDSVLVASARLYYKSGELSEASYNNFKEYWEDYWSIEN